MNALLVLTLGVLVQAWIFVTVWAIGAPWGGPWREVLRGAVFGIVPGVFGGMVAEVACFCWQPEWPAPGLGLPGPGVGAYGAVTLFLIAGCLRASQRAARGGEPSTHPLNPASGSALQVESGGER